MKRLRYAIAGAAVAFALAAVPAVNFYYQASWGQGCARCHEIRENFESWRNASHRKVNCVSCHESSVRANLRRVSLHWRGVIPERLLLSSEDVSLMVAKCQTCHQQEYAQWRSGPHSTTYARIFTDPEHNRKRQLMDDCLRCHGMHFEGPIQEVVEPLNTAGPWRLKDPKFVNRPAIPCLACHAIHREGAPMSKGSERVGAKQELVRPSLGLFDRRSREHMSVKWLPIPSVMDGARPVKMSPDRRQGLCYQCHAPLASAQLGSGDDRTPAGVHEGLSCLACHQKHGQWTRPSCAECHPRLSNCGLDVEKMDTTFSNPKSKHNIHWVKCADCHPKGVPPKRPARFAALATSN
jgi:hypothetical protein